MTPIILTQNNTFIIGWISKLLGIIMNWLFEFTGVVFGTPNIGWAIILFTILSSLLMIPLTIKQQKSSKLMSYIQPEIKAVQEKYKGKTDQQSAARMNAETKAVYEKYGTSMTGGCSQLLIQFPILIALYQVIYKIPGYVTRVYNTLEPVAAKLITEPSFVNPEGELAELVKAVKLGNNIDLSVLNNAIDFLYKLNVENQAFLERLFSNIDMTGAFEWLRKVNSFCGLDLASTPWQGISKISWAWLIPILAAVTQWVSAKVLTVGQKKNTDPEDPTQATMKSMNVMMPLMSLFFCFTLPVGVGLYWIISAVVRTVETIIINKQLDKVSIDELIEKNLEKTNKKRAKKGLPPKTIDTKAMNEAKKAEIRAEKEEAEHQAKVEQTAKQMVDSTAYYNTAAKPGSLTAKANMVAMYNQRQEEAKKGKKKEAKDESSESNS